MKARNKAKIDLNTDAEETHKRKRIPRMPSSSESDRCDISILPTPPAPSKVKKLKRKGNLTTLSSCLTYCNKMFLNLILESAVKVDHSSQVPREANGTGNHFCYLYW